MSFELPKLPYAPEALEPHITKNTIEFHYGKHHQAYVNNLNGLVVGTAFENATLEEIVLKAEAGIFNNAAQIWNHTFYWEGFAPNAGGEATGEVANLINRDFGSFASFKEAFNKAAATLFGSGWAWLCVKDGKLEVCGTPNQDNTLMPGVGCGGTPILGMDVWEHAYYLHYQNRRPDYIEAFFSVINWNEVARRYAEAK